MPRTTERYNGWTNYATWRVHLEVWDGYELDGGPVTPEYVREITEDIVTETSGEGLARDYALAFLNDVDWREIATAVNEANNVEAD